MRILIVDDEQPARDRLRTLLEEEEGFEIVGEAGNGHDALHSCAKLQPDTVLLDIRMPGIDGIETAQHLNALPAPPAVVFTTAYDEYAIDAFEARAIGYVLKPVRRRRLFAALQQAARLGRDELQEMPGDRGDSGPRRHICVTAHGELRLIPVESVICLRAEQKYVTVSHDAGSDLIDESLKSLEAEFADRFVRIHRSALVALDRIEKIEKTEDGKFRVRLRDGSHADDETLIISRRHLANVKRRLKGS